jgi:hypothetical protein
MIYLITNENHMGLLKKLILTLILVGLSFTIYSQDSKIDRLSYSVSWLPIYYGPNDGEFRLDAIIPATFEAIIHYRIAARFAISSGIGFQEWHKSYLSWGYLSVFDPAKSESWTGSVIRIPVQLSYFLTKGNKNLSPYIKTEFVNEFGKNWIKRYQDVQLANTDSYTTYYNTIDLGFGILIKISNKFNLITEGAIGTYLNSDPFKGYQIKLKIGIMLK